MLPKAGQTEPLRADTATQANRSASGEEAAATQTLGAPFIESQEDAADAEVLPYPPPSYPQVTPPQSEVLPYLPTINEQAATPAPQSQAETREAQAFVVPYAQEDQEAISPAALPEAAPAARKWNAPLLMAAVAALLIIAVTGGWFLWGRANKPPTLQSIAASEVTARRGGKVTLTAQAFDPNNDSLTYRWATTDGQIEGDGPTVTLDTAAVNAESASINLRVTLTVSDGRGGLAEGQQTITVMPERQGGELLTVSDTPEADPSAMLITLQADRTTARLGETIKLSALVTNRDSGDVTYKWTSSDGSIRGNGSDAVLQTSGIELSGKSKQVVVTVTAKDSKGEQSASRAINVLEDAPANWPPEISLRAASQQVQQGEEVEIVAEATDRDRDQLSYAWAASKGEVAGGGSRVRLKTANVKPGQVEVAATVTDKRGGAATGRLLLMVTPRANRLPEITEIAADKTTANLGEVITLTAQATDPDEETLTWRWSSSGGTVKARPDGTTATLDTSGIKPSPYPQQVTVIATAVDPRGGAASRSISLNLVSEQAARPEPPTQGEGESITVVLTAGPVPSTYAAGQVEVMVPPGMRRGSGTIPNFPCEFSFAGKENIRKDQIEIVEQAGPGNRYSRMILRVQAKKAGKPVRLTVRWRRL